MPNESVTQHEYVFDGRTTLLSVTDVTSRITYANSAFIAVSGFELDELAGQPHNIVRHPDMPREAFADMWATIKGGEPWTALVKNRRKDGDHYWVRANATPMVRDGQIVGYLSVRTSPSREEVRNAETLYCQFREGRAKTRSFYKGLVVSRRWSAWRSVLQKAPTAARIRWAVWGASLLPVLTLAAAGETSQALLVVASSAVMAAALADTFLQRQISVPLRAIRRQAQAVASGAPGENFSLNRVDDMGMVLRSVNQAGLNLRALVEDVAVQVGGVSSVSEQIAQGNLDLSARTEASAARLEETASAMDQLTSTVEQNAESARTATGRVGEANRSAATGGAVVQDVVQTMERIRASSTRIGQIVGVIDAIAFQTNILALNAAVEAARAGEAGRGFAVVADEVRTLAQRSAQAAREIRQLIQSSVHEVGTGAVLAVQAGDRINQVVDEVQRVTELVQGIAVASGEQSSGVADIAAAVASLDKNTQSNSTLVEELTAAVNSLQDQSSRLAAAIGVWRGPDLDRGM